MPARPARPSKGDQAAQGLGHSRGGFSTTIHVLVAALGNPLKFRLTSGAAGDDPQAIPLLPGQRAREVIADRGDDADAPLAYSERELRATVTIPPQRSRVGPRDCAYAAYQERRLVECFIGRLEYLRRVFARFDKYASRFRAFIHLASTPIWLKHLVNGTSHWVP